MFAAFVLELAEPPGTSAYGLAGTPPDPLAVLPWRGFVESRGSGSKWSCVAISETTGRWEEFFGVVTDGTPLDALTRTVTRSWNGTSLVTGDTKVDWQPGDGTLKIYATPMADLLDAATAEFRGTSPPPWAVPGTSYLDITGAPTAVTRKRMDAGGDWIAEGTFNETANTFTPDGLSDVLHLNGGTLSGGLNITYVDSGAGGLALSWQLNSSTPAASDNLIFINFNGRDSAGNVHTYAQLVPTIADPTNGSEDGNLYIALSVAGSLSNRINLDANGTTITGLLAVTSSIVTIGGLAGTAIANEAGIFVLRRSSSPDTAIAMSTTAVAVNINGVAAITVSQTVLTTTGVTINAGNIALQSGATLVAAPGNTVINSTGLVVLRQFGNVAGLPSAASFPGCIVHCLSTTTPGLGALPVTSDGSIWRDGTGGSVS